MQRLPRINVDYLYFVAYLHLFFYIELVCDVNNLCTRGTYLYSEETI